MGSARGPRPPPWCNCAIGGLLARFTATVVINGTAHASASFPTLCRSRQGCPTSGSLWAVLFDPIVRQLTAACPSAHDSLTSFADELAAPSFIKLGEGHRRRLPLFLEVMLPTGIELRYKKCAVTSFSDNTAYYIRRILQ